ncbi:MAG: hypothetical protein WDN06_06455 [Asticcacaulis sp.]
MATRPAYEQALRGGQTTFVTVDVTRLIGPEGLVAHLRRAGHTVERLDP